MRLVIVAGALAIAALALSCAGPNPAPTPTSTPTPTPGPVLTPSEQPVRFTVQVPAETPGGDQVFLVLLPFYDWSESERIPMEHSGNGVWSATAMVPQGGLVRYVYDRGRSPQIEDMKATRERFSNDLQIEFRFLNVAPALTGVQDVVSRWNDVPASPVTGTLRGTVTDASTGEPVWEATVSVAGVHSGTYHDGYFELQDVPAGRQRITVLADDGRYRTQSRVVEIKLGETAIADFGLELAKEVLLTFRIQVPEDTPEWAAPRITGNVPQLGSQIWHLNALGPSVERMVSMQRTGARQFEAQVVAYEGLFTQYAYTLGALGVGQEVTPEGEFRSRTILVPGQSVTVEDEVGSWRGPGWVLIEFRVRVPPNTQPGVPIFTYGGAVMHQVAPLEWALPYYHSPMDGTYTLPYSYTLGTGLYGAEGTRPDGTEPVRSFVVPSQDIQLRDTEERWRWTPPSAASPPLAVDFYVAVPPETPEGDRVYLLGDAAELGGGVVSRAVEMTRVAGTLWHTQVSFASSERLGYRFLRGDVRVGDGQERTVDVTYSGQQVLAWVSQWQDQSPSPVSPRPAFMAGAMWDDLWWYDFPALVPTTLDRLKAHGVEWVAVSQVWNYGRLEPVPLLENRSQRTGSLLIPREHLKALAREVKARGMKLFIFPQVNSEMSPGFAEWASEPPSEAWYEAYLPQLERFLLDVAAMAQEVEADMVSISRVGGAPPEYRATFNARMEEIITRMRSLYGGLITSDGGAGNPLEYEFHRLLDYQGVYWWEPLDLPDSATVEQLQAATEARLDGVYREVYQRYGKPLVITQFAYGSYAGAARMGPGGNPGISETQPVALDLLAQARLYEAFFRAVASRPWVAGMFTFGYHLVDLPLDRDLSVRAKPAETVMARWYDLLSP